MSPWWEGERLGGWWVGWGVREGIRDGVVVLFAIGEGKS